MNRVYSHRVPQAPTDPPVGGGAGEQTRARPRRVYTGEALARRKAWGAKWGAIMREHAKSYIQGGR